MADYALEVEWFDSHVGRALSHLEKIGELENTVVVFTSDHGMPFPRVKGQIYEDGFHIPLAIRWGKHQAWTIEDSIQHSRLLDDISRLAGSAGRGHD